MDMLKEAKALLKIDSVSGHGSIEVVEYLKRLLLKNGLHVEEQKTEYKGVLQKNLISRKEGRSDGEEIIFNTHLDTVPGGDKNKWTKTGFNPYKLEIEGDRLYGLGSADVKLDYLCKLQALIKYKDKEFKNHLTLVGTFGEEIGLIGCDYFLKSGYIREPKYVFVGEPTDLNIVHGHKGMLSIIMKLSFRERAGRRGEGRKVEFRGKACHSSTPQYGKCAIRTLRDYLKDLSSGEEVYYVEGGTAINILPDYCYAVIGKSKSQENMAMLKSFFKLVDIFEGRIKRLEDKSYEPSYGTINLGIIRVCENMLECEATIRTIEEEITLKHLKELEKGLEELGGKLEILLNISPMHTNPESLIVKKGVKIMSELGGGGKVLKKAGLTEGTLYNAYGAESIIYGSGSAKNIHIPNEYNSFKQLKKSVLFYERVIEEYCL